jgi:Cu-processing system permease protein
MSALVTIAQMTLFEAARRRILIAALIGAAAFLVLYAIGFHFVAGKIEGEVGLALARQRVMLGFLTLAGLYATHFLTLMTGVLLPVDTLSGEIASGVLQTVASKPVRRSSIVLGKWLAYVLVTLAYLTIVGGGVLLVARVIGHYTPPGLAQGLPLLALEAVLYVTLSIAGGARFATVTNGVLVFGLYGLAFIGNWVEQIGAHLGNRAAQDVGTVASLIMPSEAIWQRAAWYMQPTVMRELNLSPFSPVSLPSAGMVWWTLGYGAVVLLVALRSFRKRML